MNSKKKKGYDIPRNKFHLGHIHFDRIESPFISYPSNQQVFLKKKNHHKY